MMYWICYYVSGRNGLTVLEVHGRGATHVYILWFGLSGLNASAKARVISRQ